MRYLLVINRVQTQQCSDSSIEVNEENSGLKGTMDCYRLVLNKESQRLNESIVTHYQINDISLIRRCRSSISMKQSRDIGFKEDKYPNSVVKNSSQSAVVAKKSKQPSESTEMGYVFQISHLNLEAKHVSTQIHKGIIVQ